MTAYKKQTRDVWFKGRQVFDPSKRMFEEASDASRKDQEFLRDYQERTKEYSRALDNWNKNQGLLDKEKVDFFKSISKTIDTSVKNLVVDGMFIRDQKGIEAADRDWAAKPFTEKQRLAQEVNEYLKKQSDNDLSRVNIAKALRAKGLETYANFVDGQNSAYKTRIHLNILNENLNSLPAKLRIALGESGPDATTYSILHPTTGETIEFTAEEIDSDPTVADLKIRAIADKIAQDNYWTANPQGLKNDIISSLIGDKVDDIKNKFIQEQSLINKNNFLTKELNEISTNLSSSLSLFSLYDGEEFSLDPGKAEVVQNEIQNFLTSAAAKYAGLGEAKSDEKARDLLAKSMVAYVQAQGGSTEEAIVFVDDLFNGRGPHKILFESRNEKEADGSPKMVPLSKIDPTRFGVGGGWKKTLYGPDGNLLSSGATSNTEKVQNDLIETLGFKPPSENGKVGELYMGDGITLNEKWQGTIQYKWAKIKQEGGVVSEEEIFDTYQKFINNGVTDQDTLNWFRNFDPDGLSAVKTTELLKKGALKEYIVDNELVITDDIDGKFNKQAIIDWAEKNKIKIIENHFGSEDTTVLASSNQAILTAVTGGNDLTAGTQTIVNELEAEVRASVRAYQANAPTPDSSEYKTESDLINASTVAVLEKFEENKLKPGHKHYLNKDGEAVNAAPRGFLNIVNQEELRRLQNEATVSNFEKQRVKDDFDIQTTKLLNTDQLTVIFKNRVTYSGGRGFHSDKLPPYVLKMAAEAGVNPYDFVNNQAKLAGFEDWVPVVANAETQVLLDTFKPSELASIYRMLPKDGSVNINRPVKGFSWKLNAKVNKTLKLQGITKLPDEQSILNVIEGRSEADWTTVGEGDNPLLGKFQILQSDAKRIIEDKGLDFNPKEFLKDHKLQRQVITTLISEVSTEAWDNGRLYRQGGGHNATSAKNNARILRTIFNRIRYGEYINYDEGQTDLTQIHEGNLFLQNFSQY